MLTVETIGRIRREHFLKGKAIREIARDLKVSRNTVRKVLRSGETSFEYERSVQPRPKLGRWAADLDDLLAGNANEARPPCQICKVIKGMPFVCLTLVDACSFCPSLTDFCASGGNRAVAERCRKRSTRGV